MATHFREKVECTAAPLSYLTMFIYALRCPEYPTLFWLNFERICLRCNFCLPHFTYNSIFCLNVSVMYPTYLSLPSMCLEQNPKWTFQHSTQITLLQELSIFQKEYTFCLQRLMLQHLIIIYQKWMFYHYFFCFRMTLINIVFGILDVAQLIDGITESHFECTT